MTEEFTIQKIPLDALGKEEMVRKMIERRRLEIEELEEMLPRTLPEGFDKTLGELAKIGYEAYGVEADWKAYNGESMPQWDELPQHVRTKGVVATGAIVRALSDLVA